MKKEAKLFASEVAELKEGRGIKTYDVTGSSQFATGAGDCLWKRI